MSFNEPRCKCYQTTFEQKQNTCSYIYIYREWKVDHEGAVCTYLCDVGLTNESSWFSCQVAHQVREEMPASWPKQGSPRQPRPPDILVWLQPKPPVDLSIFSVQIGGLDWFGHVCCKGCSVLSIWGGGEGNSMFSVPPLGGVDWWLGNLLNGPLALVKGKWAPPKQPNQSKPPRGGGGGGGELPET